MANPLSDKIALITGAGRGIGRSIAIGYARAGASICASARTLSEISTTAETIRSERGQAIAIDCDITREDQVANMVEKTVEAFGGLDIVVNNAGVHICRDTVAESDPHDWWQTLETNLLGSYLCCRAAIPHLKARGGGKIINIGSGMGHKGLPGNSDYSCSKAGLWMLTRLLAEELKEDKISVNELIPGPVDTAMTTNYRSEDSVFSIDGEWIKGPDEVVPLALFLATQPSIGPTAQSFSLMRRDR